MSGWCVICGRAVTTISKFLKLMGLLVTTLRVDGNLQAPWPLNVDVVVGRV